MKTIIENMKFEYPDVSHRIMTTAPIGQYSIFYTYNLIDTYRSKNIGILSTGYDLSQFKLLCSKDVSEQNVFAIDLLWDIYGILLDARTDTNERIDIDRDHIVIAFKAQEDKDFIIFCLKFNPKYKTIKQHCTDGNVNKRRYISCCRFEYIYANFYPVVDVKEKAISIRINNIDPDRDFPKDFKLETRQFQKNVNPYSLHLKNEENRITIDELYTATNDRGFTEVVYSNGTIIESLRSSIHHLINTVGIEHINCFFDMAYKVYETGKGINPYLFIISNVTIPQTFAFYISEMEEKNEYINIVFELYSFRKENKIGK